MILDAILSSLAKIGSHISGPWGVAILPEMRLIPTDRVQVINPLSGYKVWLSGSVDHAFVQYYDVNKGVVTVYLSE